jgi:glutathione peroxidase
MKKLLLIGLMINLFMIGLVASLLFERKSDTMKLYDIKARSIEGKEILFSKYKDKVMLIVNVASKCGFTSQYNGLQELHEKYSQKGLAVLGLPCNQFLGQEPGEEKAIQEFVTLTYGVKFDMFSKIDVNGKNMHPLYAHLKKHSNGFMGTDIIKWNFTKFLVDKNGKVVKRYSPSIIPEDIEKDIIKLL